MSRRAVEQVGARWRIDVGDEQCFCFFDVDLDGRTYSLTPEAARALRDKLSGLLAAAERFAVEDAVGQRWRATDLPGRAGQTLVARCSPRARSPG